MAYLFDRGHYGDIRLDGLRAAAIYAWPGPIHEGRGRMQIVIDERASPAQRTALETIMTGGDTADMATMWWVFAAMSPTRHPTLFGAIDAEIDVGKRLGRVRIPGLLEIDAGPIRNPVTGAEHRARIDLPNGFEFHLAEMGSGTTRTSGVIPITGNRDTHTHFVDLHLSHRGVVARAA
jgi:hypothetical protein